MGRCAGATPASRDFVAGVMGRLAQEPAPWAVATPAPLAADPAPPARRPEASNDPVFRWKVLAGVASFLAVAALTWQVAVAPAPSAAPQLAQTTPEAAPMQWVVTDRGVVLRDPQLEELMAAHRHYGGVSALQMPAGFLRDGDRVDGFVEKPRGDGGLINGGFFVLSPKCIELVEQDSTSWEGDPMTTLASRGELMAYQHDGFWQPMDTLREKNLLEDLWSINKAPW